MRLRSTFHLLAVGAFAAVGLAVAPAASAADAAVCTWGGTELNPTGTFEVTPGIHGTRTSIPLAFNVRGELAGQSARCTGTMTLHGYFIPGSSCAAAIGYAAVGGVPGVVADTNIGVAFYIRGELIGPTGDVVGSYDDSVTSNGVKESNDACNSDAGFTGGKHWAVVTLYPASSP